MVMDRRGHGKTPRRRAVLVAAVGAAALACAPVGGDLPPRPESLTFPDRVRPALVPYCAGCHGAGECSARVCWLDDREALLGPPSAPVCDHLDTVAECALHRARMESMPPKCVLGAACLPQAEIDLLAAWIEAGMRWP